MARRARQEPVAEEPDFDHPRHATALFGHGRAEARFLEAWNSGRMHHAWLLHGPKGVGKATFAYRVARFLLSDATDDGGLFGEAAPPSTLDRPPDDPGCRRVAAGSHADLRVLEPDRPGRQILVEAARGLIQFSQLTAGEGAWRVAIVDAADDLHRSAANILLKLIEEPPARTLLLLVSHNPGRLLPTILSRCTRLGFDRLEDEAVARILKDRRPDAEQTAMADAIRLAGGSPGRALALLDGGGAGVVEGLAAALGERRGAGTLAAEAFAGGIAREPFHYRIVGETLLAWLTQAARPPEAPAAPGLTPPLQALAATASRLGPRPWIELYDHARGRLERAEAVNLDPVQTLVDILARAQALLARAEA